MTQNLAAWRCVICGYMASGAAARDMRPACEAATAKKAIENGWDCSALVGGRAEVPDVLAFLADRQD